VHTTSSKGTTMHVRTLTAATALALSLAGTAALAPAGAAPPAHHTPAKAGVFTVTASVDETAPLVGDKVTIKGKVRPGVPGAQVNLQVKYDGRKGWKTIGHDRLNGAGKFRFEDKVDSVRERRDRVVKPAGGHRAARQAKTEKVTVFGWRDLTSLTPATTPSMYEMDAVINGVAYPRSLRATAAASSSVDYNLNRDCTAFRGTAGLDDSSPSNGSAVVAVTADGVQKYSGAFALAQSAPVAFDATGVFRLTVSSAATNGGLGAVGTPQVLCSF
jgi:hypothetical protein